MIVRLKGCGAFKTGKSEYYLSGHIGTILGQLELGAEWFHIVADGVVGKEADVDCYAPENFEDPYGFLCAEIERRVIKVLETMYELGMVPTPPRSVKGYLH